VDLADLVSPAAEHGAVIGRLLRTPLLHFAVIGAVLYVAQQFVTLQWVQPRATIAVRSADLERLRSEWQRETAQRPDARQLQASVEHYIDEQVLLHEALRLGLDQRDPVVRYRLLQNMRMAMADAPGAADDAALLQQAQVLGMAARDLVVRRRLIQAMEQRLVAGVAVDAKAVAAYVAAHPQRYAVPMRYDFSQVYVHDDPARAQRILVQLRRDPATLTVAGDAFALGREFSGLSVGQIAAKFDASVSDAVAAAPVGQWIGPLRSPYGWHLLRVEQQHPVQDAAPDAAQLRSAAYALQREREQQALRAAIAELRSRYRVQMLADTGSGGAGA
jgi:hypothetical protein